ncbi:hypothetical protein RhiJN_11660 [Ceratobasidium sp. AG-Ba]|nr:hypothetical protein RhiJN_11660 [Ceratobasidium sp. AG-Ba]
MRWVGLPITALVIELIYVNCSASGGSQVGPKPKQSTRRNAQGAWGEPPPAYRSSWHPSKAKNQASVATPPMSYQPNRANNNVHIQPRPHPAMTRVRPQIQYNSYYTIRNNTSYNNHVYQGNSAYMYRGEAAAGGALISGAIAGATDFGDCFCFSKTMSTNLMSYFVMSEISCAPRAISRIMLLPDMPPGEGVVGLRNLI